jgi:hypothetical protein
MRQKILGLTPGLEYTFNSPVRIINNIVLPKNRNTTSQHLTYAPAINAFW